MFISLLTSTKVREGLGSYLPNTGQELLPNATMRETMPRSLGRSYKIWFQDG